MKPAITALLIVVLLTYESVFAAMTMVNYNHSGKKAKALLCKPDGAGPFPAVVYSHGKIVDMAGYQTAKRRGYDLDGICKAISDEVFLVLLPCEKVEPAISPPPQMKWNELSIT